MTDSARPATPVRPGAAASTTPVASCASWASVASVASVAALAWVVQFAWAGTVHAAEPTAPVPKAANSANPAVAPAAAPPPPAGAALPPGTAPAAEAAAPAASAGRGPTAMRTPYRPRKPGPIGGGGGGSGGGAGAAGGVSGSPAASFGAAPPISPGAPGTPAAATGEPLLGTPIKLGPGDPLERLRERLARGVALDAAAKPGARGTPEIKVDNRASGEFVIKAPPAGATAAARSTRATPGATRVAAAGAVATTGAEAKHGSDAGAAAHGPAWGYAGGLGPQAWASLHPAFSLCGSGQRQSPVDIRDGLPVDLEAVDFLYRPGFFSVTDNGHTVQVQVGGGNAIEVGARRYELTGFHFHIPGEERVDGRSFAMSIHLVHRDAQGRLAVVALVAEEGPEHPAVRAVWNNLPLERGEFVAASVEFDPTALLPARRGYYTYMGSLTTPPCTEGVLWIVMQQPIQVSPQQLAIFARLHPMNARPVQPLNGRVIKQSR